VQFWHNGPGGDHKEVSHEQEVLVRLSDEERGDGMTLVGRLAQ
jgi:hypothetical protein